MMKKKKVVHWAPVQRDCWGGGQQPAVQRRLGWEERPATAALMLPYPGGHEASIGASERPQDSHWRREGEPKTFLPWGPPHLFDASVPYPEPSLLTEAGKQGPQTCIHVLILLWYSPQGKNGSYISKCLKIYQKNKILWHNKIT